MTNNKFTYDTFYFTYGTDKNMPFQNGWTEITAPTRTLAVDLFNHLHPNKQHTDTINCAFVYTSNEFKQTTMYKRQSNLGNACVEHFNITIS